MNSQKAEHPSKMTPKELIELCENCPYDDCVGGKSGCPAYRARERSLKEKKPKPASTAAPVLDMTADNKKEEPPATPPARPVVVNRTPTRFQLAGYNAAISALEKANEVTDTQKFNLPEVSSIIEQLKGIRFTWFSELVDWDVVANPPVKGGPK